MQNGLQVIRCVQEGVYVSQFEIAGDFNDDFVGGLEEVAFRCWCFGCCRRFWFGHLLRKRPQLPC